MTQPTVLTVPPRPYAPPRETLGPIVVAVGGTDATSALRAARALALDAHAGVLALAVVEPPPALAVAETFTVVPIELESDRRAALLERVTDDVSRAVGPDPAWRVRAICGDPARAIADVAGDERAQLLVMGTGRHRLVDRLFGETTLRTIRRARCPVLAVGPAFAGRPRTVVVATDFSPASAWAAESVVPLLAEGATLHLVHVWQPIGMADSRTQLRDDAYRSALPDRFARLTSALTLPDAVTVAHEIREGAPASRLAEFAAAHHADLIVAGRHGLGVVERILVGSVTTGLLRRAPCSVYVAPEPPFADADRFRRAMTDASAIGPHDPRRRDVPTPDGRRDHVIDAPRS